MAARRSNKRTRRGRKQFGFLYKIISFLIILVVIMVGCAVFFRVDSIIVSGQSRYTAEAVIAASGVQNGDNLFALNKFKIARRILTDLPYVDEVVIRRTLPAGLVLTVSECRPTTLVRGGTAWWVVDTKGKILEETSSADRADVAKVTGITAILPAVGTRLAVDTAESAKLTTLLEVTRALTERGMMDKTSAIDLTGNAALVLTYDGRFAVKMPLTADFMRKTRAMEKVIAQLQSNEKGSIDMTREDKVYVNTN